MPPLIPSRSRFLSAWSRSLKAPNSRTWLTCPTGSAPEALVSELTTPDVIVVEAIESPENASPLLCIAHAISHTHTGPPRPKLQKTLQRLSNGPLWDLTQPSANSAFESAAEWFRANVDEEKTLLLINGLSSAQVESWTRPLKQLKRLLPNLAILIRSSAPRPHNLTSYRPLTLPPLEPADVEALLHGQSELPPCLHHSDIQDALRRFPTTFHGLSVTELTRLFSTARDLDMLLDHTLNLSPNELEWLVARQRWPSLRAAITTRDDGWWLDLRRALDNTIAPRPDGLVTEILSELSCAMWIYNTLPRPQRAHRDGPVTAALQPLRALESTLIVWGL